MNRPRAPALRAVFSRPSQRLASSVAGAVLDRKSALAWSAGHLDIGRGRRMAVSLPRWTSRRGQSSPSSPLFCRSAPPTTGRDSRHRRTRGTPAAAPHCSRLGTPRGGPALGSFQGGSSGFPRLKCGRLSIRFVHPGRCRGLPFSHAGDLKHAIRGSLPAAVDRLGDVPGP